MRYLLQPGDCALVDDPGYYNLFGNLRMHGVEMLAVPRRPDGPDLAALEALAAARRPKVYFTQSAMQNPTGSNTSPHLAFRLLQAAERHDFTVVEDDIFCDLQSVKPPRTRDARPAQSRHLCEELLEDAVGKPARRIRGLDPERGRRARRHQDADLHHDVAIHRTPALSHACRRALPKTLVAGTGASWGGAGQRRAGFRANRTRNVCRADRRNVHLGAAAKHRGTRSRSRNPLRAKASCSRLAPSFDRISNDRPGCDSTLRPATTLASWVGSNGSWQKRRTGASDRPSERVLAEANGLTRGTLRGRKRSSE